MRIGLTFDLRSHYLAEGYGEEETAEFDRDDTIEALEEAIFAVGYEPVRIGNVRSLLTRLVSAERWDLVFNIAEGLRGFGREAQIPALLEAYGIPYTFSDPLVMAVSLHKGMTKALVAAAGVPTPAFEVVEKPDDVVTVDLRYPLFVKPVAEGTSKGVTASSFVSDPPGLRDACEELLGRYGQPVLVERYLPGREFTVGVLGSGEEARTVGALEVTALDSAERHACTYWNKEFCEEVLEYRLASDFTARQAEALALKVWRCLGCRDAGRVDFRADAEGRVQFLEVNPLAGLHPTHSDLPILCTQAGMGYGELIGAILESALKRASVPARPHVRKRLTA